MPSRDYRESDGIRNAFTAFKLEKGDIARAFGGGEALMQELMAYPIGSRFIISQRWGNSDASSGHDYNAERTAGGIRFVDAQMHLNDASGHLSNVGVGNDGKAKLWFARVDDKELSDTKLDDKGNRVNLDFSRVVMPSSTRLDNSADNVLRYNKVAKMTKEEALELLKNYLKPEEVNGCKLSALIGEYRGYHYGSFVFTVYHYSDKKPLDFTYGFTWFVDPETKEVSSASAPLTEDYLKWSRTNCEKLNITLAYPG
ncbi:MAG: hypothetical protein FWG66_14140 [Spirochaetes bacterium]|nr:hypothetical protein [Spirochaetota bacterium]